MAFAWSCPLRSVRLTAVVEYDGKQLDLLWLSTYTIDFGSRKWEGRIQIYILGQLNRESEVFVNRAGELH